MVEVSVDITGKMIIPTPALVNAMGRRILKTDSKQMSASPWLPAVTKVMQDMERMMTISCDNVNGKVKYAWQDGYSLHELISYYELTSFNTFTRVSIDSLKPTANPTADYQVKFYRRDKDGNEETGWTRTFDYSVYRRGNRARLVNRSSALKYPDLLIDESDPRYRTQFDTYVENEVVTNQFLKRFGILIDEDVDINKRREVDEKFISKFVSVTPL